MRSARSLAAVLTLVLAASAQLARAEPAAWSGVDETVVERVATEAGRPPREPYINTDRGDLLLFVFLLAGAAGGFVAGYTFHALFVPRPKPREQNAPAR